MNEPVLSTKKQVNIHNDNRITFLIKRDVTLPLMYARYQSRIKELEGTPALMYDYMARAAPFLKNYDDTKNKKDLFSRYLLEVENEGSGVQEYSDNEDTCRTCGSRDLMYDDCSSDTVCTTCGSASYVLGTERGYKEDQDSDNYRNMYSYKRENHFNEWITQFQAKEITEVPESVFESLRDELRKQKIQKRDLTHTKVRECLKKLKLNKYYEHVPYISSILNGVSPPAMSPVLEEKLRNMFHKIQKPFEDNCPAERKNFLSYSYILYKFCELLSEDRYLGCFPLLKSKEKLYKQDQIWKLICKDLNWEFIPTSSV
jgi:hypothetical protein